MGTVSIITFFTALSFIFFGKSCLHKPYMKREFMRYNLSQYRIVVGVLQLLGGFGLLVGYYTSPYIIALASFGLFLLMIMGVVVRFKIKDNILQTVPAIAYAFLSAVICYNSIKIIIQMQ